MNYKGLRPLFISVLIMKRYFLLFAVLFYSSLSFSSNEFVEWRFEGGNFPGTGFGSTKLEAIQDAVEKFNNNPKNYSGLICEPYINPWNGRCASSCNGGDPFYGQCKQLTVTCSSGETYNYDTRNCEEEKICSAGLNLGQASWSKALYGYHPYYCLTGCIARPRAAVCNEGNCSGTVLTDGQKCAEGQEEGIYPKEPNETDPNEPDPTDPPETEPNEPDPNNPPETYEPNDPTKPIEGGGGVVVNPTVPPVNPNPTNPLPDPTAPENGDVVSAVVNMNRDMNKAMDNLALSVNKSSADTLQMINAGSEGVKTQLAQLESTQIQIYENEKALTLSLNSEVVNAVNGVGSTVGGLGDSISSAINESIGESMGGLSDSITGLNEGIAGLGDSLGSINEGVAGIGGTLDALANFDSSGVTICGDGPCPEGFYTAKYDKGFSGVFDENFVLMKDIVSQGIHDVFGAIDLSNAEAPSFCMKLWMYGDFCFTDHINLDWIFGFIRAAFMFATIFYSRKLIIGG